MKNLTPIGDNKFENSSSKMNDRNKRSDKNKMKIALDLSTTIIFTQSLIVLPQNFL